MSNLRPGVQILIDQMESNPEEFFGELTTAKRLTIGGRAGKFSTWTSIIEAELIPGARHNEEKSARSYTWFMSDEEKAALAAAYVEARRARFDAEIIATMAEKPEELTTTSPVYFNSAQHPGVVSWEAMRIDSNGVLDIGTTTASNLVGTGYVVHGGQNGR